MPDLEVEIRRVLYTSYPISLKNFDSALKEAGGHAFKIWACSNLCQISALAGMVVGALEFCPYALSVLEQIGHVSFIRDAVLQASPALLDGLLFNAMQDENNFDKYSQACLSLLSTPLSQDFPPPAQLVPFFLRCVEIATNNTTAESIRTVYILVTNGFGYLSELLSPAQKHNFNRQMAHFLTIQGNPDTNVFLILSLATLAHMATESTGNILNQNAQPKGGITDFFIGKRALKVLPLVTNIVIEVAARDIQHWEISTELIQMATLIVETVADDVKQQWCRSKEATTIDRLLEKAQRMDMHNKVISELLRFVLAIYSNSKTPVQRLQATFDNIVETSLQHEDLGIGVFLPCDLSCLISTSTSKDIYHKIIRKIFRQAYSNNLSTHRNQEDLDCFIQFLQSLRQHIPTSSHIRKVILCPLNTEEFKLLIDKFVACINETTNTPLYPCKESGPCPWSILASIKKLQLELCTLILECGLYSQSEDNIGLNPQLGSKLMEMQTHLFSINYTCPRKAPVIPTYNQRIVTLFEASATPETYMSSRNWRQSLLDGLARETDRQHNFVVSAVGEVCRDLEKRCEGIEKPLREEKERVKVSQVEATKWKSRCVDLEDEVDRMGIALRDLKQEKDRLENTVAEISSKTEEHENRVTHLKEQLGASQQESKGIRHKFEQSENVVLRQQEEIKQVRDATAKTAMENMILLNERQDKIEELINIREQLESVLEEQRIETKQEISSLRNQKSTLAEKVVSLEAETLEMSVKLQSQKAEISLRDEKVEELEQGLAEVEEENQTLKHQHIESKSSIEELELTIQTITLEQTEIKQTNLSTLESLQNEHATEIARLQEAHNYHNQELTKQKVSSDYSFTQEIHNLRETLHHTRLDWAHERETQQSENCNLAKKIHKLQTHQEQKEKEAQVLTRQLLGLMTGGSSTSTGVAQLLTSEPYSTNSNNEDHRVPISPSAASENRRKSLAADIPPTPKRLKRQPHPKTPSNLQQFLSPLKNSLREKDDVQPSEHIAIQDIPTVHTSKSE